MYGHEQYKATDIETASSIKLVVMLYAGAVKFLNLAVTAIETKQFDQANYNIIRAQNIVGELLASLNFDAGDIADNLSGLYIYIHKRILEGNIQKDTSPLKESILLLEDLKSGWDELLAQEENAKSTIKNINISG